MIYNTIYGGYSLNGLDKISNLYYFQRTILLTAIKNINTKILYGYIVDVDNDNFKLKDYKGNDISSIKGYFFKDEYINEIINFPAPKTNNLYKNKDYIYIFVIDSSNDKNVLRLLKDSFKYKLFDDSLIKRKEKFLNIMCGAQLAPIDGKVSIDNDKKIITISNDNKTVTLNLNEDTVVVKDGDEVKQGDYVDKNIEINLNKDNIYEVKIKVENNTYVHKLLPKPYKII